MRIFIVNEEENFLYNLTEFVSEMMKDTRCSEEKAITFYAKCLGCNLVKRFPANTPDDEILNWIDEGGWDW